MKKKFPIFDDGIIVKTLKNENLIKKIQNIVKNEIKKIQKDRLNNTKVFRSFLNKCQKKINLLNFQNKIIKSNENFFKKILDAKSLNNEVFVQTNVYLRGVRPHNAKFKTEFLDWHRENFYNDYDYINYQINCHFPLLNYNLKNSMKIIPGSQKIEDKKIKLIKLNEKKSGHKRFSIGHKLGLPYHPKKIIKGINLKKQVRVKSKPGEICVFSSRLIHGGKKLNK